MSEEALSQTTLRALLEAAPFLGGAFAPRAEAAAALLSADASALDTLSDAQIGALALATCGCLDRGTYSGPRLEHNVITRTAMASIAIAILFL